GIYFWLIWAVAGGNVIWYGFAGLGFLMLMLFGGVNTMWKEKGWPKVFIISYLIIWLVASFYLRSNTFFSRTHTLLPHIGGLATTDQMATLQWPGILNVAEILNENPEDTIILTNLGRVVYFTDANHERIFVDQFYDLLNCFYNERDEELFVERLKASGFDFIALSPLTNPDEHFPDEYYDVQREIMEAIDNNFDFAFVNKFYLIYEI
ncbi:hypothetical protein HOC37_06680, partial [bacterium]|nr:hypothetical protein [bacterium]